MSERKELSQPNPEGKNYYEILGVSPEAIIKEIEWYYRRLMRINHPDAIAGLKDIMNLQHKEHPYLINDFDWTVSKQTKKTMLINEAHEALLARAQLVGRTDETADTEKNFENWIVPDINEWKQISLPEMKTAIKMLATMPEHLLSLEFLRINWDILDDLIREGKLTFEESNLWVRRMTTKANELAAQKTS